MWDTWRSDPLLASQLETPVPWMSPSNWVTELFQCPFLKGSTKHRSRDKLGHSVTSACLREKEQKGHAEMGGRLSQQGAQNYAPGSHHTLLGCPDCAPTAPVHRVRAKGMRFHGSLRSFAQWGSVCSPRTNL